MSLRKKYCLILFLILGGAVVFLLADFSRGYNTGWTHPTLAEKSARLFNQYDGGQLSEADIQQIVQGVINEDTPPRWINHFYDPTSGQGWTGERMGVVPTSVVGQISSIGLSQADAVPAPNWAQNQELQSSYSMYEGNHTFQKAVYDYVNGDKASAYRSLGHILHLIEDMTVPAHTRQDTHLDVFGDPGEPFEKWVEETKDSSPLNNLNPAQENFHCRDLNDCFNQIAKYSNENFFSEDTILDNRYAGPAVKDYIEIDGRRYAVGKDKSGNKIYLFVKTKPGLQREFTVDDLLVQSAYWQRLSKEAVLGGVEVIRIFQEEAVRVEKDKSLLEKPPATASPIFSLYGTYVQLSNGLKNLWSSASSKLGSLSGSLLSLVGGGSDIPTVSLALPEGLTINQAAISQLSEANQGGEEIHPTPPFKKEGGDKDDAPIVNIVSQNFPQPINIVPKIPMVLGETTGISNNRAENQAGITGKTVTNEARNISVSNSVIPPGAGLAPSVPAEEAVQRAGESESPAASSTPSEEDFLPPETYATSTPALSGQITATSTIIFEFSASEPNSTFGCRLDNASFTICVSPVEYQNLADGEHSFEVAAIDAAGNRDLTPVIFDWTVDATVSEISLSLVNYQLTSINFTVAWTASSSEAVSYEIQYKVGENGSDAGWQDWVGATAAGQKSFQAGRDDTTYYFRGRAKDNLGNQSVWQEIAAEISQYPVVINEIAWMGTSAKYSSDEWIELYNKTDRDINLGGWILSVSGQNITLATTVPAHSFYLLERTDNDTIFDLVADQIFVLKNGLSNYFEILELRNKSGQLIDSTPPLDHSPGYAWVAGAASPNYQTMERLNPYRDGANIQNWATNNGVTINGRAADGLTPVHGTPKAQNSQYDPTLAIPTIISDKTIINSDTIWSLGRSPYIPESNAGAYPTLAAGATLIIEPGVVIKPQNKYYPALVIKGRLLAQGTSEKPILFTSNQATPQPGDWASVIFKPESVGSVLANVIFEYGGRESFGYSYVDYSMVTVDQSSVTIKNCQFRKAGWSALKLNNSSALVENSVFTENVKGIVIDGAASHPIIRDSEFRGADYQGVGIEISGGAAPVISSNNFSDLNYPILLKNASPVFSGNRVSNNNYNGVYVHWQTRFTQDVVWQNDLIYILMSNAGDYPTIASGTVLTIEPGTVVKPISRYYTALVVQGRLVAEGTVDQPIIFTSFKDDSVGGDANNDGGATAPGEDGDWKDVVFAAGSSGSLDNIYFKYGGFIPGWISGHDPYKTLNIDPAASGNVILGDSVIID